ncbi:MAG: dihydropteroate synthase [Candidatus Marinimicrobia bacterium]|nr:dihydropteroate synthase [Candidatus Neomarinimicrobiota bacterium]
MGAIREIITPSPAELAKEFDSLNVDQGGVGIMSPKSFFHVLRLRRLKSPAANILKQEMLSVGGECAASRTVILGDDQPQDAIIMGTRRQLAKVVIKLKAQPFGLRRVAEQIDAFLKLPRQPLQDVAAPIDSLAGDPAAYPLIMGILNITTDSFSDGGSYFDAVDAVEHGLALFEEGAEIVDVGGESTRPGSEPVAADEELSRVVPVIAKLRERTDWPISIDTMKAPVAREALRAGATLVNDVSAGRHDPEMFATVAEAGCPYVMMHMQGEPKSMQHNPHYEHLMDELHRFFDERLNQAVQAGVAEEQMILDPGIGFGKRREDSYEILRRLGELRSFGRPLLVGVSRKSFLQNELGETPQERLEESIAAGTIAMVNGAAMLRVHDVRPALKSRAVVRSLAARL